ncbi:MAG TPA: hypothetical protein VMI12_18295 [Puia sp.]|nr:hypothetical protein [Puia sp.]
MLAYKKLNRPDKSDKSDKSEDIFCCCDFPKPPYDPGTGDCCYDFWNTDLADVTSELKCATAIATHKQKEYGYISDWYGIVKSWYTDWEAADHKADDLCRSLELFIKHLERVCKITHKTAKAIDILFCMIQDLYIRVDCLKERYDQLIKCINCLKNPALASGGIIACLANYSSKLDAVILTRDILIGKVILAIEYAYELHDSICDEYGLKAILIYWTNVLNCHNDPDCKPKDQPEEGCVDHCVLEPSITFPLDQSEYYLHLKKLSEDVKKRMDQLKKESDDANEAKTALEARQNGLKNAIAAAGPSVKCGNGTSS